MGFAVLSLSSEQCSLGGSYKVEYLAERSQTGELLRHVKRLFCLDENAGVFRFAYY